MAIVKRTARKRTLSFWGRDGHQIRLAFPYHKPSKLEYMTHKFKINDKNLIAAFKDSLDLNQESTCQEYFTDEAESSKKKVHLDNNGSILYEAASQEETMEHALDSKTSGHDDKGKERSKIHNRNHELARNKRIVDHLDVAGDKEALWAILGTHRGTYHSAQVSISVHELPQVAHNQESRASLWVINRGDGSPSSKDVIQAGWHVYPDLYGDSDTHFFVHWAAEGGARGCFNLRCEGFVLSGSATFPPGCHLRPFSKYNGTQYYLNLKISKDQQTGDWWLYYGVNHDLPVGYWPKSLFTGLQDSATHVQYGGVVRYSVNDVSPPMGSGRFADEGHVKAASLTAIGLNDVAYDPTDENFFLDATEDACYTITMFKNFEMTKRLYFGGPGDCPA